jgi:hypothetical protein
VEWNAKNVEKDIYFLLVFEKKKNLKIDILQQKSFLVQFLSPINSGVARGGAIGQLPTALIVIAQGYI